MKNLMKNVLAVSVVAAMAMSVAACSGDTAETSAAAEETVAESVAETEAAETEAEETEAAETTEAIEYSIDEAIIGEWTFSDAGADMVYTFNDDNTGALTMTEEGQEYTIEYTYSADGENITLYMEGFESDVATYTVDGDTLSIDSEGNVMELTR